MERTLGERDVTAVACDIGGAADSCAALKQAAVRLAVLGLPLSGIDRYDAPPRAERPAPSKVARVLEGPLFATVSRRPVYEGLLAEEASRTVGQEGRALPQEQEPPAPAADAGPAAEEWRPDPLSRAAAEHLAAHTRYLEGQLHTAEQLTRLLSQSAADGRVDASLAAAVNTVAEHSLALGDAHTRAGEVISSLLRLPANGQAPPPGPYPHGDASPELSGHREADDDRPSSLVDSPAGEPPADSGTSQSSGKSALAQLWAVERGDAEDERPPMDIGDLDLEELERVFREVVAEKTGYDVDMIEPDMDIQTDLGIDSLKQVEIGAEMWRRYPVISRGELHQFSEARTVRELIEKLHEVLTISQPQLQFYIGDGELGRAFVALRELPEPDVCPDAYPDQPHALLLDDGGDLSATLDASLRSRGWRTSRLYVPCAAPGTTDGQTRAWGLEDWEEATLSGRLAEVLADEPRLDLCVLPISPSHALPAAQMVERLRYAVLVAKHVCPALRRAAAGGKRVGLVTVTQLDGALGYAGAGGDPALGLAGGLSGLVKTVALEETSLFCRALDFAPGLSAQRVGDAFIAEITDIATDLREVARDETDRRTPFLSETPFPPEDSPPSLPSPREAEPADARESGATTTLTGDDLLLVTGGASGITAWCVAALAREHRCGYLLLGRTPLAEEPDWAAGADSAEELRAALQSRAREAGEDPREPATRTRIDEHAGQLLHQRRIRTALDELRAQGVEAEYVAADVRDAHALAQALAPYAPRITGVIHGAGVLGDRPLAEVTAESITPVVDTKLRGLQHVLDALDVDRLRHLVLFSSVSGIWGNLRQADYALANEALNRFGCAFQVAHPRCRVVPIAWGPWTSGMASAVQQLYKEAGVPMLTREAGCAYFLDRMSDRERDAAGVTVVGPLVPLYRRVDQLPPAGITAHRLLTGLGKEPVLRDHRIGEVPVLPMTAAVGWALHTAERAQGGSQPVFDVRDFRIVRGVFFPEGHPERYRIQLKPEPEAGPDTVRVTVHDATTADEQLHYEGVFRRAERAPDAPREQLPHYEVTEALHPGYDDGRLFHGPTLAGLRNGFVDESDRLIVTARMPDPPLGKGSFGGRLYSPALADLLLQAGLLNLRRQGGDGLLPMPVSVERIELFTPLPSDEPFVIISSGHSSDNPLFTTGTLTACAPDGRIHQRWSGVRSLWIDPETAARGTRARTGSPIRSQLFPGTP